MRRLLIALLVAVALVVAGLVALPFLISDDLLRGRLAEQIASVTGRDVSLSGEPAIRFFPEIRVTVNNLAIAGPPGMADDGFLTMKALTGTVRLLPLIIGRVEFRSFKLDQPVVRLVRDAQNRRNWNFDTGAAALQLAFSGDVLLGRFELNDGVVIYEDHRDGESERFDAVNLVASWPSVRNAITLAGALTWNGEQVAFDGAIESPFDLIRGQPSPARANLSSAQVKVAFEGQAFRLEPAELSGAFDIAMPSLRSFVQWIGSDVPEGPALGPTRLAGTARFQRQTFSITDAQFELDDNVATGALRIALEEKPRIEGTLAFATLNLSSGMAGEAEAGEAATTKGETPPIIHFATDWLDALNADIRISAGTTLAGALELGDTAASVILNNALLTVGLAQSTFHGGQVTGNITYGRAGADDVAAISAQLQADAFDVGGAAALLSEPGGFEGTASMSTDIETRGSTFADLVANLSGATRVRIQNGRMPGIDLDRLAAALDTSEPVPGIGDDDATEFNRFDTDLVFGNHAAVVEKAILSTDTQETVFAGTVGLVDGRLDLSAFMRTGDAANPQYPFELAGTLRQPQLVISRTN